jgi:hypothetical protein
MSIGRILVAKYSEVGVEHRAISAHHHELTGLIGGHQQRGAELLQQRREAVGVHAAQGSESEFLFSRVVQYRGEFKL